jgi:hypothetical protein
VRTLTDTTLPHDPGRFHEVHRLPLCHYLLGIPADCLGVLVQRVFTTEQAEKRIPQNEGSVRSKWPCSVIELTEHRSVLWKFGLNLNDSTSLAHTGSVDAVNQPLLDSGNSLQRDDGQVFATRVDAEEIPGPRTGIGTIGKFHETSGMARLARLVVPGLPHHIT